MATTAARLRRGLYAGHSPQMALACLKKYEARVKVDAIVTVRECRKAGLTWREIGDALGMTESGARRKYEVNGG